MFTYKTKLVTGAALGFFGGLASGLLGIGGGALLVPIMTLAMTMSINIAIATSMFTMIFTSISGVIQHYTLGNTRFEYAIPIALGTVVGAQLGTYASKRLLCRSLSRIFGIMLIAVSIQMIDYEVYLSVLPLSL
ncbi:MAG: TSUP family transporter [Candidatus Bathycorpusculaceae bacterium]